MIRTPLMMTVVLLLAGCGTGGAGGGGAATNATTDPPSTATTRELGMRDMPDGQVTVTALTALLAGRSASFHIALSGMSGIRTVEVLLGSSYEEVVPLTVTADGDGWRADTTLPDPLPSTCRMLVRLTAEDGSVQETGKYDFIIAVSMPSRCDPE